MAEINEKVMDMVEKELGANPDTSTTELFELAKRTDPAMKELSVRQFHARYPLQVKRKKSLAKGGGRRRKKAKSGRRGGAGSRSSSGGAAAGSVHAVLLAFAREVSRANDKGPTAMLEFVASIDSWVAKVEKARR